MPSRTVPPPVHHQLAEGGERGGRSKVAGGGAVAEAAQLGPLDGKRVQKWVQCGFESGFKSGPESRFEEDSRAGLRVAFRVGLGAGGRIGATDGNIKSPSN